MRWPDLRALDRRLVPTWAARLRRGLDRAVAGRASLGAAGRRGATSAAGGLARLDDRLARRGPLALAREVPQLALLVVAVVLLAGAVAALSLSSSEQPAPAPQGSAAPGAAPPQLGVPPGTDVDATLDAARVELAELAQQRPDSTYLALVSLAGYLTPVQTAELLDGLPVQRVYLRAPAAGERAEVVEVPLTGMVAPVLTTVCERTAERRTEDAARFAMLAATIGGGSEQELAAKAQYEQEAGRARLEAQGFTGECGTAFAAVVEAPVERLAALSAPQVRGVQVAAPGATVSDVDVVPVSPDQRGVVPQRPQGDRFR